MKRLKNLLTLFGFVGLATLLASCGGSGAGGIGGNSLGVSSSGSAVSSLVLAADAPVQVVADVAPVKLTAYAKDTSNVGVRGAAVTFSSTDAGINISPAATTTDSTGALLATVTVIDRTPRIIKIVGTSGTAKSTIDLSIVVGVTPSTLLLTSDGPNIPGDGSSTVKLIAIARNASGSVVKGAAIIFSTTDNGLAISPLGKASDDFGVLEANLRVIDTTPRKISFTATSGGVSAKYDLSVVAGNTAASLVLNADSTSIGSDGRTAVKLFAVTKNADNVALKDIPVFFSTSDIGATISTIVTKTDATGVLEGAMKITDKTTRVIRVLATSGSLTAMIDVAVLGTTISVSGPITLGFNLEADYTVLVKDSSGNPISGKPVAVTSANTVVIQPSTTDSQGQAKFRLRGTNLSGVDNVRVVALGSNAAIAVSVTSRQLLFVSPNALAELAVGGATTNEILMRYIDGGVPQAGQVVSIQATRGTILTTGNVIVAQPASFTTNAAGEIRYRMTSASSGFTTLTANVSTVVSASNLYEFVSTVPTTVTLQAGPSVVGVNLANSATGAALNSAQIIARVTDGINPVKGKKVTFRAIADDSNGRIDPPFAYTDSYGQAIAAFIAGPIPTGIDQVVLEASVEGLAATATSRLTVAKQEISIRIGVANVLEEEDFIRYKLLHTVLVTDNAGRPVPDAKITVSVESQKYSKGFWEVRTITPPSGTPTQRWNFNPSVSCPSEDINRNGRLDTIGASEDFNLNGTLEPGNVSTPVMVLRAGSLVADKTSSDGFADFNLIYPKIYAVTVEVRITVSVLAPWGTEYKQSIDSTLLPLAKDLDINQAPPGLAAPSEDLSLVPIRPAPPSGFISPFGFQASCAQRY